MNNEHLTTCHMLQACLEMFEKLIVSNKSNMGSKDRIHGEFDSYTLDEIEDHINSLNAMKKRHTIRIEVEVHCVGIENAIEQAISELQGGVIFEIEHSDNGFNDSSMYKLSDLGIPNIEWK